MEKDYSYTIGVTTPLVATDNLRKGDYIYYIDPKSDAPFEKVWQILSRNGHSYDCVSLGDGQNKTFDISSDDLTNLHKLQLPDVVRNKLGIA